VNGPAAEPRLLIPQLKPFYDLVDPLSWLLIRMTVGLMILPHGWPKLLAGIEATAAQSFIKRGLWIGVAEPMAVFLILLETVGGICVALGLFTRFFAVAIAVEMATIVSIYIPKGYGWTGPGYEYAMMWGLVMLAVALRGGGPYSLDRRIGREL
jgi:putative oxidoreductase